MLGCGASPNCGVRVNLSPGSGSERVKRASFRCVCVPIHIYIYAYAYIYIYQLYIFVDYVRVYVRVRAGVCANECVHAYVQLAVYMCKHTYNICPVCFMY